MTHFGRVSSSKKPSLVMPRFAPMKIKEDKKKRIIRPDTFSSPSYLITQTCTKGTIAVGEAHSVFHKCNGRGHRYLTWYLFIAEDRGTPPSGNEDVWRRIFLSIDLYRGFRVVSEGRKAMDGLNVCLKQKEDTP